jgi:acyl-CoA synthetase (AMP-forming)/AMP-acid ligase II
MFRGYANDAIPVRFTDGFYHTGDIGTVLPSGHVRVTGRLKDVVIRNAENISAVEVESVLYGMPQIVDVAIIGVPDRRTGERCCAVGCVAGAETVALADVVAHCRSVGLAPYKIPEQLEIVDSIPRNPMVKIRKDQLRERFLRA